VDNIQDNWVEACLEHLSRNGPWSLDPEKLCSYVYNAFLFTDIRLSTNAKNVIPSDVQVAILFVASLFLHILCR
jgi:hypothetical protein